MGEHSTFFKQKMLDGLAGFSRKGRTVYAESRDVVHGRSKGWCEIRVPRVCTGRGVEFHHKLMRSAGGPDTPDNLVHTCPACHLYVHRNPSWSYRVGWLLHRLAS